MGKQIISQTPLETCERFFLMTHRWLGFFQTSFKAKWETLNQTSYEVYIQPILRKYEKNFHPLTFSEQKHLKAIPSIFGKYQGTTLAILPQHLDFHTFHIKTNKEEITGVFDWENFQRACFPCIDILNFVTNYTDNLLAFLATVQKDPEGLKNFAQESGYKQLMILMLRGYLESLKMDPKLLELFIPVYVIHLANEAANPDKKAYASPGRFRNLVIASPKQPEELLFAQTANQIKHMIK